MKPVILKRAVLLVKKSGKFGLNGFYIVNLVNRDKITMTGFDPIFGIMGLTLYAPTCDSFTTHSGITINLEKNDNL